MKALILSLVLCFSAYPSEHIVVDLGDGTESHGTCFVYEDYVVTCSHVMHGRAVGKIWYKGDWVEARLVGDIPEFDIAYLKPVKPIKSTKPKDGFYCDAGAGSDLTQTRMEVKEQIGNIRAVLPGFKQGGSGSPIYKDGKLVGMAFCMFVGTDIVGFVPEKLIKAFKP